MLRQVGGDVGWAMLVWIVAGVLSLLGALTYGELGALEPEAGGLYVFVRNAFGRFAGFLLGWTMFFVIASGSVATLAVAFAAYSGTFITLGPTASRGVALMTILVIAAINVRGTRQSAVVQNWSTAIKAGMIVVLSAALLVIGRGLLPALGGALDAPLSVSLLSGVGVAMIGVLWAYEGWQYVTFSVGEAVKPQRDFPRAIAAGTVILIALYLLANVGYLAALGADRAAASERIASEAAGALFGTGAARVVAAAILVSMFSAANAVVLTASRIFFAMARDGLFFRKLAEIHPRFGTPAFAVVAMSVWSAVLAATGTFEQLLTYVVFIGWIFYALGAAAVFVFRRRRPDAPRAFRVPGYPWTPALFVLSAAAIVLNTIATQPGRALIGIGIVLLGAPAYAIWNRSAPSAAAP